MGGEKILKTIRALHIKPCVIFFLALLVYSANSFAAEANPWWITVGGFSIHAERQGDLNQVNLGLGAEYDFAPKWAAVAGTFKNSNYEWSQYAGVNWLPLEYSVFKFGLTAQISNHYRNINNGGIMVFAAPMISTQYGRYGANIYLIPPLSNVTAAVAVQFKMNF